MIKISNWNVAGYLRLSKEDNENMESNSIVNQRELIEQYISGKEDLELIGYYIVKIRFWWGKLIFAILLV